jgi:hypothetical protein
MSDYIDCVDCGHLQDGIPCWQCQDVGQRGKALALSPAERREMSKRHKLAERRRKVTHDRAPALQTDTNWSRRGMVEQGFNNNQPLENRADFERERKAKGMEIVTVAELKNTSPANRDREVGKQIQELAEKYCRA